LTGSLDDAWIGSFREDDTLGMVLEASGEARNEGHGVAGRHQRDTGTMCYRRLNLDRSARQNGLRRNITYRCLAVLPLKFARECKSRKCRMS
jgi:hypothetical protein